mgnify:CR=1 FL=1
MKIVNFILLSKTCSKSQHRYLNRKLIKVKNNKIIIIHRKNNRSFSKILNYL